MSSSLCDSFLSPLLHPAVVLLTRSFSRSPWLTITPSYTGYSPLSKRVETWDQGGCSTKWDPLGDVRSFVIKFMYLPNDPITQSARAYSRPWDFTLFESKLLEPSSYSNKAFYKETSQVIHLYKTNNSLTWTPCVSPCRVSVILLYLNSL